MIIGHLREDLTAEKNSYPWGGHTGICPRTLPDSPREGTVLSLIMVVQFVVKQFAGFLTAPPNFGDQLSL